MNYRKLESARLLKMLDSTSIGELEQKEIKAILEDRQRRQAKAIAAIEATDIRQLLRDNNLDWEIHLFPLLVSDASDVIESSGIEGTVYAHETLHWPVRIDNMKLLGRFACTSEKAVMQNKDLIELGLRLANSENSEVTFAKALGEGESIMVAILAGTPMQVGPDRVQRYIYLLDNRTGEHGLRIGFGETNLRCTNQLNFVNRNAAHTLRHTKTFHGRIESLIESYDALREEMDVHQQFVQSLAEHMIEADKWDDVKYEFIDLLFNVDLRADYSNVRVPAGWDKAVLLDDCIEEEAEAIGYSLWTLLNGVTRMTTHNREQLYPRSEVPGLESDIAYGKAGEIAAKANEILQTLV